MTKTKPVRFTWGRLPHESRLKKEEAVREFIREERRRVGYTGTFGMLDVMREEWGATLIFGRTTFGGRSRPDYENLNGIEFKDPKMATLFWLKVNETHKV